MGNLDKGELAMTNKLIILTILDCMSVPLNEEFLHEIITENSWMDYIDIYPTIKSMVNSNFIIRIGKQKNNYSLTDEGKECLTTWHASLAKSLRDSINEKVTAKRNDFRKKQEYFADYSKNADGSYTVNLVIRGVMEPILDIKINIQNRAKAKWMYETWNDKAPNAYELLFDLLSN